MHLINQSARLDRNPLDEVSEGALFEWCAEDPPIRFPTAAAVVSAFTPEANQNPVSWTPIEANQNPENGSADRLASSA